MNNNKKGIPVYLSEKEIRVIKVALWKHLRNIADDNGGAYKEEMQSFVDCCYETYRAFEGLDDEKKKFDELDEEYSFDEITLDSTYPHQKINDDELFREFFVYEVGDNQAYMMAIIEGNGLVRVYNMDEDHYYDGIGEGDYGDEIPEPVLKKLVRLAENQIKADYEASLNKN